MLHDNEILNKINMGSIYIDPLDITRVQPASIDLTLGGSFMEYDTRFTEPVDPIEGVPGIEEYVAYDADVMVIAPGRFVLGTTAEKITVGDTIAARLEGKSSLARLGLLVHATAGFIDPGFSGRITLEMYNCAPRPIRLYAGMSIAQIAFIQLTGPAVVAYGDARLRSKYQDQSGPVPSRYRDPKARQLLGY